MRVVIGGWGPVHLTHRAEIVFRDWRFSLVPPASAALQLRVKQRPYIVCSQDDFDTTEDE